MEIPLKLKHCGFGVLRFYTLAPGQNDSTVPHNPQTESWVMGRRDTSGGLYTYLAGNSIRDPYPRSTAPLDIDVTPGSIASDFATLGTVPDVDGVISLPDVPSLSTIEGLFSTYYAANPSGTFNTANYRYPNNVGYPGLINSTTALTVAVGNSIGDTTHNPAWFYGGVSRLQLTTEISTPPSGSSRVGVRVTAVNWIDTNANNPDTVIMPNSNVALDVIWGDGATSLLTLGEWSYHDYSKWAPAGQNSSGVIYSYPLPSAGFVMIRGVDAVGRVSIVAHRVFINNRYPGAVTSISAQEYQKVTFSASGSSDLDAANGDSVASYDWKFYELQPVKTLIGASTDAAPVFDFAGVYAPSAELIVADTFGARSLTATRLVPNHGSKPSLATDESDRLWMASSINNTFKITVMDATPVDGVQKLASVPGREPSMLKSPTGELWCYREASTGMSILTSATGGRLWTGGNTASTNLSHALSDICLLPGRRIAICTVITNTGSADFLKLQVQVTQQGLTPAPAAATVTTLGKLRRFRILARGAELLACDGLSQLHRSIDGGRTWAFTALPWGLDDYIYGDACILIGGAICVLNIEKSTKRLRAWQSDDNGDTWSDPAEVATLTKLRPFTVHQRSYALNPVTHVTDGQEQFFTSFYYGREWAELSFS